MITLQYRPVDKSNWSDLENLFESKGGPHNCWCMAWRKVESGGRKPGKADKKNSLHSFVETDMPIGLIGYSGLEPIAWCSIAPRESYRELSGDTSITGVWSLVCLFIKKKYRNLRISEELIKAAIKYAKENGARYVEAYPVDPDSPSYRFMGFKPVFDKIGFKFKHNAGQRRHVMIIGV